MMLLERLSADISQSMKSGNKTRVAALRMVKSAIKNAEIAQQKPLDDAGLAAVLSREVKQRRESIAEFKKANRQDAVDTEEAQLAVILEYLPQQMNEEEIEALVREVIDKVGAQGPKDKGKVMSQLMPQVKGKADGQLVNRIVTQVLDNV